MSEEGGSVGSSPANVTTSNVIAVLATFNRARVLHDTLIAIEHQTRRPDSIVVVDNASTDDTREMLARDHPDVTVVVLDENRGAAGGLHEGLELAFERGADFAWIADDDTTPDPGALESLLGIVARLPVAELGILALSGGSLRHGFVKHLPVGEMPLYALGSGSEPSLHAADFVIYDGGLVSRRAFALAGTPRADFFHDFGDLEYSMRVRERGLLLIVADVALAKRANLGSGGAGGSSPPWRGYYRTRNQLRAALDRRSPTLVFGWFVRDSKLVVATLLRGDQRWSRIRLRLRGVWDACTNRLGRRVDPESAS
jgi:GT2 family glycosyltransferase